MGTSTPPLAPDEVKANLLSMTVSEEEPDIESVKILKGYLSSISEDAEGLKALVAGLESYRKKKPEKKAGHWQAGPVGHGSFS